MKKFFGILLIISAILMTTACTVVDLSDDNSGVDNSTNDNSTQTTTSNTVVGTTAVDTNVTDTNVTDTNVTVQPRLVTGPIKITCNFTGQDDIILINGLVAVSKFNTPFKLSIDSIISELVTYDTELYYKVDDVIHIEDNPSSVGLDISVTVKDINGETIINKVCYQPSL